MSWDLLITQFKHYLRLERALADNSIEAYVRDIIKLKQFAESDNRNIGPLDITHNDLTAFI